ncbi:Autoinducer 2 sensor kinase/phosphatase LuxQ [compost metagenome]
MMIPPKPANEADRLASLYSLRLLDTPHEERFDRVTRLARYLFDVPITLVSLVDVNRQWFKSCQGLDVSETERDISFCGHAILEPGPLVIVDATADPRFADNPLVVGEPHIRFYAGHPLKSPDGHAVGTLCLIDMKPRAFGPEAIGALADLAAIVEQEMGAVEVAEALRERERIEAALRQQTVLTELLQAIAIAANEANSVEACVQACLDRICALTGWPVGHLYLRDTSGGTVLQPTSVWHLDDPERFAPFKAFTESLPFSPGEGMPGQVYESGKPVSIVGLDKAEGFRRLDVGRQVGLQAGFAFPLLIGAEVVGVLEFFATEEVGPDESLLEVMAHTGTQLGRVVERERASSTLQSAKDEAERASRAKSSFLANMSHELRTPLNAILGYSEMLAEEAEELGYDQFVPDLQKVHGAGKHLLNLINDILDLSKIEAGKMELYLEEFEVTELIEQVVATIQPLIDQRGNRFEVTLGERLPIMRADLTKVRQTLFNLLSNASKFTEGGLVSLSVTTDGSDVLFRVRDTGIGMTEPQVAGLFQEFAQADVSTTRKYGGTGLGLAISQRFAEMMGGRIAVQSEMGVGSTFTLRLPVRVAEPETPAPSMAGAFGVKRAYTVLAIDDDPVVLDLMERSLLKEGYHVITAATGKDGLRLARELEPDAITLDAVMPGMDGWMVLAELKADPALAHVPVVMLTMLDDRPMGLSLGATEYLVKPMERTRLIEAIGRVLAKSPSKEKEA